MRYAKQQRRDGATGNNRSTQTKRKSQRRQQQSLRKHKGEDAGFGSAQSRTHADLASSFGDAAGKYAVDSGSSQHQGNDAESFKQYQHESTFSHGHREQLTHGNDTDNGLIFVDSPDGIANRGSQHGRIDARSDDKRKGIVSKPRLRRG